MRIVGDYIKAHWMALVALLISFLSLFFTILPQFKPFNDNYVEKANAGDVKSQMFLANLNYEVGNTSESVHWYSIAMTHSGKYQGKAINNLAYIYLNNEEFYITRKENYQDAMRMFKSAMELGEADAAKNLYILLAGNPKELFGEEYDEELAFAKETLKSCDAGWLEKYNIDWKYIETIPAQNVPANDDEYKYVEVGDAQCLLSDGKLTWVHTYQVFRKMNGAERMEYIYIKIDE